MRYVGRSCGCQALLASRHVVAVSRDGNYNNGLETSQFSQVTSLILSRLENIDAVNTWRNFLVASLLCITGIQQKLNRQDMLFVQASSGSDLVVSEFPGGQTKQVICNKTPKKRYCFSVLTVSRSFLLATKA